MSETVVTLAGVRWAVQDVGALLARWAFAPPAVRPRVALGCERCRSICVSVASECACCRRYKTRTNGGTLSFPTVSGGPGLFNYDEDAPKHRAVVPFAELIEQLKAVAA